MANSLIGIELENGGVMLKFVKTAAETGGAVHVQEARYPAHSRIPPYHRHPKQVEHFEIVEGGLTFRIDGVERIVSAGDHIEVPKGAAHLAHNHGDVPALVIWETRPALRTGEFFFKMNRAMRGRARPGLIDAAAILTEYRDEFQLADASLVQRVVMSCLAPFGKNALRPPGA